jgi:transcriptional regulator with XRE-family HTH domain
MSELGKRVAQVRKEHGWTQRELARRVRSVNPELETTFTTISSIEIGKSEAPTILTELAIALGVSATWLRTGSDTPSKLDRIFQSKPSKRPHYIAEWMERRNLTKADLARDIGAGKAEIMRWLEDDAAPDAEYADRLKAYFGAGVEGIFSHPDADWLTRFFEGRRRDEIERIKATLETAFPQKKKTSNGD